MSSSVGPNTADIIKWIVENYTDLSVDSVSHLDLQTKIDNYPSNFALFDKRDALQLIEDIAWQSRCVVYARNGTVYFKYLSEMPTPLKQTQPQNRL